MLKESISSRLRRWFDQIPGNDPIELRTAALLQVVLLGVMAVLLIALVLNWLIAVEIPWYVNLIRSLIALMFIGVPFVLLRRGHFKGSVFIIMSVLFLVETYALTLIDLRKAADTLPIFTVVVIMAGLLVGRRVLALAFILSSSVVILSVFREPNLALGSDASAVAGNFILINGLICLFVDSFGTTLRTALRSALERERELQNEVLERKRAEEATRKHAETTIALYETNHDLVFERDLSTLLQTLVERAVHLLGGSGGGLYLCEPESSQVCCVVSYNTPVDFAGVTLRYGEGAAGYVAQTGEPLIISDYSEWGGRAEIFEKHKPFRAVISAPIKWQEEVIGVIEVLEYEQQRSFSDDDLKLVESFANQAAVAVQNARLYHDMQLELAERKRAEEELHKLNLELEQRVRERTAQLEGVNQELDAFSYSVSHDLRAPLRALDGYTRLLAEDYASQLPGEAQKYINNIMDNAQRMGALIRDLLTLSRVTRQAVNRERIDLSDIARITAESLENSSPERTVEFVIAKDQFVNGDAGLLQIAMENLISNAWKYTSRRDRALIEFGSIDQQDNGKVYFVRDNGIGFDMANTNRLFSPFTRLHPELEFEGTGIGLTTVQRIIYRHGGQIWAEAAPDQGATFYFTLAEA